MDKLRKALLPFLKFLDGMGDAAMVSGFVLTVWLVLDWLFFGMKPAGHYGVLMCAAMASAMTALFVERSINGD